MPAHGMGARPWFGLQFFRPRLANLIIARSVRVLEGHKRELTQLRRPGHLRGGNRNTITKIGLDVAIQNRLTLLLYSFSMMVLSPGQVGRCVFEMLREPGRAARHGQEVGAIGSS